MYQNQFIFEVLIKGKSLTEYQHQGQIYIEGRHGSEFELFFKNNSRDRVLFVPSVDGLSVFDGKPASSDSKGYIVDGWSSLVVPGWTLDAQNIAKFTFAAQEQSYSSQSGQGTANVGVIGAIVFSEKQKAPVYTSQVSVSGASSPFDIKAFYSGNANSSVYNTYTNSIAPMAGSPQTMYDSTSASPMPKVRGMAPAGATTTAAATQTVMEDFFCAKSAGVGSKVETLPDATLGTAFGQQSEFKTNTVSFDRDAIIATLTLFYNSRRNLERLGIQVVRGNPVRLPQNTPNPFPANRPEGCVPPQNWAGGTSILDDLLSVLTDKQKVVMSTLLNGLDESELKSKYAEYLPAVLKV